MGHGTIFGTRATMRSCDNVTPVGHSTTRSSGLRGRCRDMDNKAKLDRAYGIAMFGCGFIILGLWVQFGAFAGMLALGTSLLSVGLGIARNLEQEAEIEKFDREFEEFRKKHGIS